MRVRWLLIAGGVAEDAKKKRKSDNTKVTKGTKRSGTIGGRLVSDLDRNV